MANPVILVQKYNLLFKNKHKHEHKSSSSLKISYSKSEALSEYPINLEIILAHPSPHRLVLSVPPPHIVTDGGVFAYGLARGSTHRRQVPPLSVTATTKARRQEPMPDKSPGLLIPSAHLRSIDKSVLEEEPRDWYSRKPCIAVG